MGILILSAETVINSIRKIISIKKPKIYLIVIVKIVSMNTLKKDGKLENVKL
jgi:hypothetical protein